MPGVEEYRIREYRYRYRKLRSQGVVEEYRKEDP